MKRFLLRCCRVSLLTCSLPFLSGQAIAQGSINPPSGPTVPIMKTLTEVEPRTAIPGGGAVTISTPGSYYLTGNITYTGTSSAISIIANQVTLDLNGFTITNTGSGIGISTPGAGITMLEIKNGSIRGGTHGVRINGSSGTARGVRLEKLRITDASVAGIWFNAVAKSSVISDCLVADIGPPASSSTESAGIYGFGGLTVERCSVDSVVAGSGSPGTGIDLSAGAYALNNRVNNCSIGFRYGKVQGNFAYNCTTPYTSTTDAGNNN